MSILEIILIGAGLAMDASAVCLSAGLVYRGLTRRQKLSMPLAFALFQGLMPVAGYFLGRIFADAVNAYSGMISFIILGIIGAGMIKEAFSSEDDCPKKQFTVKVLLIQAVATSIDAFAVGVGFAVSGTEIFSSAAIIAAVTFVCSLAAVFIGQKAGEYLGCRAQIVGGAILILIGLKALLGL